MKKRNKLQSIFSLMMAVMLVIGVLPVGTLASNQDPPNEEVELTEEVEIAEEIELTEAAEIVEEVETAEEVEPTKATEKLTTDLEIADNVENQPELLDVITEAASDDSTRAEVVPVVSLSSSKEKVVDLVASATTYQTTTLAAYEETLTLNVQRSFEASSDRTITIKLGMGMNYTYIPAMKPDGNGGWTFDVDKSTAYWPNELREVITGATYTANAAISVGPGTAQYWGGGGEVVYTIANTTSSVALNLLLQADKALLVGDGSRTLNKLITVGFGNQAEVASLDTYQLDDANQLAAGTNPGTNINMSFQSARTTQAPDNSYDVSVAYLNNQIAEQITYGDDGSNELWLFNTGTASFRVHKDSGAEGFRPTDANSRFLVTNVKAVDSTDANYVIITSTISINPGNVYGQPTLSFYGTIPNDAVPGHYKVEYIADTASMGAVEFTDAGGGMSTNGGCTKFNYVEGEELTIIVPSNNKKLTLGEVKLPVIASDVKDSPAAMSFLHGFTIANDENTTPIGDKRIVMDFDTETVGVLGVKLPVAQGNSSVKNIVVTTTTNRTINVLTLSVPTAQSLDSGDGAYEYTEHSRGFDFAVFSLTENGGAEGEYIKSIAYNIGEVEPAAYTSDMGKTAPTSGGAMYYGKLLKNSAGDTYQAKISAYSLNADKASSSDMNDYTHDGVENDHVETVTVEQQEASAEYLTRKEWQTNGVDGSDGKVGTIAAGTKHTFVFTTNMFRASPEGYSGSRAYKGMVVYIRVPERISIDPNDIRIGDSGEYTVDSTEPRMDSSGRPYYTVTIDEYMIGRYNNKGDAYDDLKIDITISVHKSMDTSSLYLSEIVRFAAIDARETPNQLDWGGAALYSTADTYGFVATSKEEDPTAQTYYLGKPPDNDLYTLKFTSDAKFIVETSADKDDGNWKIYDGTDKTIIDLNENAAANYKAVAYNNTGKDTEYSIIIPIPQAGEPILPEFQYVVDAVSKQGVFTWTLELEEKLGLQAPLKVFYSANYTADFDSTDWIAEDGWTADFAAVKTIKIENYKIEAEDDEGLDTIIPLMVPEDAGEHGAVNIYTSYVSANVGGNTNPQKTEPVALRLNTGVKGTIDGYVYLDRADDNGAWADFDGNDVGQNGIVVELFAVPFATSTTPYPPWIWMDAQYFTTSDVNGNPGYYQFTEDTYRNYITDDIEKLAVKFINAEGKRDLGWMYIKPWRNADYNVDAGAVSRDVLLTDLEAQENYRVNALIQEPFIVDFKLPTEYPGAIPPNQWIYSHSDANRRVTKPTDPVWAEHYFVGWYKDAAYKKLWEFGDNVTGDTTLYGRFEDSGIAISKEVAGAWAETEKEFTFTVKLMGDSETPLNGAISYKGGTIAGTDVSAPSNATVTLTNGSFNVKLKHGQKITIVDVEAITGLKQIQIVETDADNYETVITDSKNATALITGCDTGVQTLTAENRQFAFVNTREEIVPSGITSSSVTIMFASIVLLIAIGWIFIRRRRRG